MRHKKKKRGFTLVELLIVIAISGILMAMSAPKYQGIVDKADELEQRAHVREALNHIDIYNLDADSKIVDSILLESATGLGEDFSNVRAKITGGYERCTIGSLRQFAEGEKIVIPPET